MRQSEAIRDALSGWSGNLVLAGDLNDVADSPPFRVLTDGLGLADAYLSVEGQERPTFDAANGYTWPPELVDRCIDHVLVRGAKVLEAAVVLDGAEGPVAFDHSGVRAVLDGWQWR